MISLRGMSGYAIPNWRKYREGFPPIRGKTRLIGGKFLFFRQLGSVTRAVIFVVGGFFSFFFLEGDAVNQFFGECRQVGGGDIASVGGG